MGKKCDACEFLKNPSLETQILDNKYWSAGIDGCNHAYLRRAYVTLEEHKPSLSSLSQDEWTDFQEIVRKLDKAPLNWGCFMNHAFRTKPFDSHVHWRVFPRYEVAPVLDGITFDDPLFGEFYDDKAQRLVSVEVVEHIASKLRQNIE
jgi:diadenosine tetraphosphate (Ap4A) HIT family hydrolase